jgi:hypothetical protein
MYAPLAAVARMLTAARPPLPAVLEAAGDAAELAARTELESLLAELAASPERLQGLPGAAPTAVWLAAATSGLHARRFIPYLGPASAFEQHVSTMVHRTLLFSYWDSGWQERDHFRGALRQFENLRHLLRAPAADLVELQHVRLHLADLSNYMAFAAYRMEISPAPRGTIL